MTREFPDFPPPPQGVRCIASCNSIHCPVGGIGTRRQGRCAGQVPHFYSQAQAGRGLFGPRGQSSEAHSKGCRRMQEKKTADMPVGLTLRLDAKKPE